MSLFCPATLIVARHGEAAYTVGSEILSDEDGVLTDLGRAQAAALADALRDRRVALVYTSPLRWAVETGMIVAEALGVQVRQLDGLQEFRVADLAGARFDDDRLTTTYAAWLADDLSPRIPGGESGEEVLARFDEALSSIADLHRGETVLVISHGGAISLGLPRLALGAVPSPPPSLANGAHVEVQAGDDGWTLGPWPGA
ncbi:histidine phosphatase family protein [Nostocoides jenkinsii]|uniref:Putative isomerase n=1 Tax=Nostocoides jenkinsii Ben 74 TaxID=1193518 RepID=A0A077M8S0_9MICO|nr:histidine phosphatase family protein [Tetrasphaera jenkinsii]CCI52260.1 putative isomerase [Tetrasphaera jenkinsii Ben 74]